MIVRQKIDQLTFKGLIVKYLWLVLIAILVCTGNSFAEDVLKDPLEDEDKYAVLDAEELNKLMKAHTGHTLDSSGDYKLAHIKHGIMHAKGDSHYVWFKTTDGNEHILRVDKHIQGNKHSPPVKIKHSDLSDLEHFGLQKRVELGLKNKGHSTETNIHNDWINRIFSTITHYDKNNKVSWNDWYNHISLGTLPPTDVRKEYNTRMTQVADHLQNHIDTIGSFDNLKPETARMYQNIRREMGKVLKNASTAKQQAIIYKRNVDKYGDKYGPTYRYLKEKKGYSHQKIAVKSVGTEGKFDFVPLPLANNKNEPVVKKLVKALKEWETSRKSSKNKITPAPTSKKETEFEKFMKLYGNRENQAESPEPKSKQRVELMKKQKDQLLNNAANKINDYVQNADLNSAQKIAETLSDLESKGVDTSSLKRKQLAQINTKIEGAIGNNNLKELKILQSIQNEFVSSSSEKGAIYKDIQAKKPKSKQRVELTKKQKDQLLNNAANKINGHVQNADLNSAQKIAETLSDLESKGVDTSGLKREQLAQINAKIEGAIGNNNLKELKILQSIQNEFVLSSAEQASLFGSWQTKTQSNINKIDKRTSFKELEFLSNLARYFKLGDGVVSSRIESLTLTAIRAGKFDEVKTFQDMADKIKGANKLKGNATIKQEVRSQIGKIGKGTSFEIVESLNNLARYFNLGSGGVVTQIESLISNAIRGGKFEEVRNFQNMANKIRESNKLRDSVTIKKDVVDQIGKINKGANLSTIESLNSLARYFNLGSGVVFTQIENLASIAIRAGKFGEVRKFQDMANRVGKENKFKINVQNQIQNEILSDSSKLRVIDIQTLKNLWINLGGDVNKFDEYIKTQLKPKTPVKSQEKTRRKGDAVASIKRKFTNRRTIINKPQITKSPTITKSDQSSKNQKNNDPENLIMDNSDTAQSTKKLTPKKKTKEEEGEERVSV